MPPPSKNVVVYTKTLRIYISKFCTTFIICVVPQATFMICTPYMKSMHSASICNKQPTSNQGTQLLQQC